MYCTGALAEWPLVELFPLFFFSSRRRHTRCALVTGVQTCALPILDHLDDRRDAAPLGPEPLRQRAMIFDLRRGVRAIAHLVLEAHDAEPRVARAVGQPARDEEAGEPAFGIGAGQERIAHRRHAETGRPEGRERVWR